MHIMGDWTFFSNYGHVLVCLARNRDARLRDVAEEVGVTERAVQTIVRDLQGAGYLTVTKQGRCNRYHINKRKALRHGLEAHCTVGKLLALVTRPVRSGQPEEPEEAAAAGPVVTGRASVERTAAAPAEKAGKKKQARADTRRQGSLF
jgi:hypothetical protein